MYIDGDQTKQHIRGIPVQIKPNISIFDHPNITYPPYIQWKPQRIKMYYTNTIPHHTMPKSICISAFADIWDALVASDDCGLRAVFFLYNISIYVYMLPRGHENPFPKI